jgi:hypothetical protein
LKQLSPHLNSGGSIIIDNAYIEHSSSFSHPLLQRRDEIERQIAAAGMRIAAEEVVPESAIAETGGYIFSKLEKRCNELIEKYPEQKQIFANYIANQKREQTVLENLAICSVFVLSPAS